MAGVKWELPKVDLSVMNPKSRKKKKGKAGGNWLEKSLRWLESKNAGVGGGAGIGCGFGLGMGVTGSLGLGSGPWNNLRFMFGVGAGCGVGVGIGFGHGLGVLWDRPPPSQVV